MDFIEKLQAIAQSNGGIIETKTAVEHGISRATLSRLCKENRIIRIVIPEAPLMVYMEEYYEEMCNNNEPRKW